MLFDNPKDAPPAGSAKSLFALALAAPQAPPGLYPVPRTRAHGEMCAMLRTLHRFPPFERTHRAAPAEPLPLDRRILWDIGYSGFETFRALQFDMARTWEHANAIRDRYLSSVNI